MGTRRDLIYREFNCIKQLLRSTKAVGPNFVEYLLTYPVVILVTLRSVLNSFKVTIRFEERGQLCRPPNESGFNKSP